MKLRTLAVRCMRAMKDGRKTITVRGHKQDVFDLFMMLYSAGAIQLTDGQASCLPWSHQAEVRG